MLTLQPAKGMQGNIDLPSSPDLLLVAIMTALASGQRTRISPVQDTPLTRLWESTLKGHATITVDNNIWTVDPLSQDASLFLVLPYSELPYRDLIVFTALGMGKTVAFKSVTRKKLESWSSQAKRFGYSIDIGEYGENLGLSMTLIPTDPLPQNVIVDENDFCLVLGLMLGRRTKITFQIDYQLSNPLRHLAGTFGFEFTVKSLIERETDPIARRLKFMKSKKKVTGTQGSQQLFNVILDFTNSKQEQIECTLPGDEILGAVLLMGKCLIPKGSLALGNMLIETWSCQILNYIRKIGGKISVQETARTSFGSAGMVSIQKFELFGRKVECIPLYQYIPQLPSMIVLAAFAEAQSVFREIEDLRLDNPDGIDTLESCIRLLGARHGEMPDGIVMEGGRDFDGFDLSNSIPASMSAAFAIAGLRCLGTTTINEEAILQRWPNFEKMITDLFEFRSVNAEK